MLGHEVERRTLSPNATALRWDGAPASGGTAPAGSYTLLLDARDANGKPVVSTISASGTVASISREGKSDSVTFTVNLCNSASSAVRNFTVSDTAGVARTSYPEQVGLVSEAKEVSTVTDVAFFQP